MSSKTISSVHNDSMSAICNAFTCSSITDSLNGSNLAFAIGSGLKEQSYYISPDYFKHGKYPGTFKYIDLKDRGRICEVFIKEVIYSNPATVVIWSDGTRTTARTELGDTYSGAFGLIYCILKKTQGSDAAVATLNAWAPTPDEDVKLENRSNRDKPVYKTLSEIRKLFKHK